MKGLNRWPAFPYFLRQRTEQENITNVPIINWPSSIALLGMVDIDMRYAGQDDHNAWADSDIPRSLFLKMHDMIE